MSGDRLHKYDLQLCAYAVDSVAEHMERPGFAQGVKKALASRPLLLAYLLNAADKSLGASDERLVLGDGELMSLAGAVEGEVNLLWEPDDALHGRYVETIIDVRENLSRQAAEGWSEECARFGRQLGEDRVPLTEGIDIVRQWVRRLRYLLRAMDATDLLPQPEGRSPTPTLPDPVPRSSDVQAPPSGTATTSDVPPAVPGNEDIEIARPASPTRAYCLQPPNVVHWDGKTEIQQRLWHLLGLLLDKSLPAQAEAIEEIVSRNKVRSGKSLRNDLSALNNALVKIKWPITYRCKGGYVTAEG